MNSKERIESTYAVIDCTSFPIVQTVHVCTVAILGNEHEDITKRLSDPPNRLRQNPFRSQREQVPSLDMIRIDAICHFGIHFPNRPYPFLQGDARPVVPFAWGSDVETEVNVECDEIIGT